VWVDAVTEKSVVLPEAIKQKFAEFKSEQKRRR